MFYANALHGEFIWDDSILIVYNPAVRTPAAIRSIFSSPLYPSFPCYYRPLQTLSYSIEHALFGLQPFYFHLTNLILHILNALLVYAIVRRLTNGSFVAMAAALFFVAAPFHTEAVAYISGRADLLASLFLLAAFWAHLSNRPALSVAGYLLALLSREQTIIFPLVLLGYDFFFGRPIKAALKYYLALAGLAVWYLIWRVFVVQSGQTPFVGAFLAAGNANGIERLLTFAKDVVLYLGIVALPLNLHMEREISAVRGVGDPYVLGFAALALFIVLLLLRYPRQRRLIGFGLVWFALLLLPQSSLLFPSLIAEHFIYLSCIGIFLIVALFLQMLWEKRPRFAGILVGLWVLFYGGLTLIHNINWKDMLTFCTWTLKFSPRSYKVHYMLASYYAGYGLVDRAVDEYRKALDCDTAFRPEKLNLRYLEGLYPQKPALCAALHHNLGVLLTEKGFGAAAESQYRQALELAPSSARTTHDLGCLYLRKGDLTGAIELLQKAIALKPDFAKAYYNLGVAYALRDEKAKARSCWQKALRLEPGYRAARISLEALTPK